MHRHLVVVERDYSRAVNPAVQTSISRRETTQDGVRVDCTQ